MYGIDLLKAKGIPLKSRPGGAALMGISFAVPVIVVIVVLGNFLHGRVMLPVKKQALLQYESKIEELSNQVELQKSAKSEIDQLKACLKETAEAIKTNIQWSSVLRVLVEEMPDSLVLQGLDVQTQLVPKRVPDKTDPSKSTTVTLIRRILTIRLYGRLGRRSGESDKAILQFQQSLRESEVLSPMIDSIRGLYQMTDEKKGLISYSIECVFEPE